MNWQFKLWWKVVFHMWNHPKPAPEYQLGWRDRKAARKSLRKIVNWDFDRIVLAHGETVEQNAKAMACEALKVPLDKG